MFDITEIVEDKARACWLVFGDAETPKLIIPNRIAPDRAAAERVAEWASRLQTAEYRLGYQNGRTAVQEEMQTAIGFDFAGGRNAKHGGA